MLKTYIKVIPGRTFGELKITGVDIKCALWVSGLKRNQHYLGQSWDIQLDQTRWGSKHGGIIKIHSIGDAKTIWGWTQS
jgi:hypothetical protein